MVLQGCCRRAGRSSETGRGSGDRGTTVFAARLMSKMGPMIHKLCRWGGFITATPALRAPGFRPVRTGARPRQAIFLCLLALLVVPLPAGAVPAGTVITNTARASYDFDGSPQTVNSNEVNITTVIFGTPSVLELFRYSPSDPSVFLTVDVTPCFDGGGFIPASPPTDPATGEPIDISDPVPVEPAVEFTQGDAVFVRLSDLDGNTNPAVADTLRVVIEDSSPTGVEMILLTETGPDTGIFTGYILSGAPSESANDGILYGFPGSEFTAGYTDPLDGSDSSSAVFIFDPENILWVTASAGKETVSVGDYLTYTVTVENTSGSTVSGVDLAAVLPPGFRYLAGTARIDGVLSPDPAPSQDGRSVVFTLGDIPPGGVVTIKFVTAVGAGAKTGKATARYTASNGLIVSNTGGATVKVIEDLMRSRNTIMGRVLAGACGGGSDQGVEGIAIFLEDGTRVVTDETGRYHFEGVRSGTHVVQVDLESIPEMYDIVACDEDTRQAGRAWSRFVDLAGGSLWRVDFYLVPKAPQQGKAAMMVKTSASSGQVKFNITMSGERVPISNVRLRVTLPDGVEYVPGSIRLEGKPVKEPDAVGGDLFWNIGGVPGGLEKGLTFETRLKEGFDWMDMDFSEEMTEVKSSVALTFDTPADKNVSIPPVTNVLFKVAREEEDVIIARDVDPPASYPSFAAELTTENRDTLDLIAVQFDPEVIMGVTVTGHSDNVPVSEAGQGIYADNYELSRARAQNVVNFLRETWDLQPEMFTIMGVGPDEPIASNETVEGRELNRRVENDIYTITVEKRAEVEPVQDDGRTEMVVIGLRPGEVPGLPPEMVGAGLQDEPGEETVDDDSWRDADPGLAWIHPAPGFAPRVPGIKVAVKHDPRGNVRLTVNGVEAHELNFMGTEVNSRKNVAMSLWRGIELSEGDNLLKVEQINSFGMVVRSIERSIHLSGPPAAVEFLPEESSLVADGRTPLSIAVRLTDRDGYPARCRSMGQFFVDLPHEPLNPGGGNGDSFFGIEENGIARLRLKATSKTGQASVRVKLQGGEEAIDVWLVPEKRDWILVGLAEGTAGYNVASGNMESLEDSGKEEDLYSDGRLAFFAKGRIKGKYLLTMSYDTDGPHGAAGEGHHGTIDPDTYYTLYGDAAEQGYEAPTSKKLFLKIEKDNFYTLFGDTDTGLTVTELARYNRRITGLRSELKGRKYSYNLFAYETEQGFVKDEIPGDGTSGLYRLSAGEIVVNSETVTIEVRDRFQSHVVISSTPMHRHTDYSIDYDEGTLFFKKPVSQRDEGFNPVFIVVDYETEDPGANGVTYGARGEMKLPDGGSAVGLSVIHEDQGDGEGDLVGLDTVVKLSGKVSLKAEAASSSGELFGEESEGSAYILEVDHDSDRFDGKVYLRQQDEEFGLGQQRSSEAGMRKAGAQGRFRLTQTWELSAEVLAQENLETGEERTVEELGAIREKGRLKYSTSIRQATDSGPDEGEETSQQVTADVAWESEDGRLKLGAGHEQSLGDNENKAYPSRTHLRSDYRLASNVSLSAEQEFTNGDETSVNATRLGLNANPWEGGTISSSVNREFNENGERVYAATGLDHTWQVTPRWKVSGGFEGASVIQESTAEPLNDNAASVSSEEDYTAVSVGTGYNRKTLEANLRLEARYADNTDKWGIIAGVYNEPAEGIGLSSDLKHFRTEGSGGETTRETDLRFGLVYRPWDRYWTFLDKLKLITDEESGSTTDTRTWKMVNNFNANYRPHDDLQVSFLLGTKYVKETIEGQVFDGYTYLVGSESRWDLSNRWDIGAWASALTTEQTGTTEYGLGASLGYGLMENIWLSFGYNFLGFTDSDFSGGDFTAQGPYVKFRLKFDQETLKEVLAR